MEGNCKVEYPLVGRQINDSAHTLFFSRRLVYLLKFIPWNRVGDTRDIGSVAVWLARMNTITSTARIRRESERALNEIGVRTLGVDYLSVSGYGVQPPD